MNPLACTEELARLDNEILRLERLATAAEAGLAEHIVLEAARRMRIAIASDLAGQSSAMESASR